MKRLLNIKLYRDKKSVDSMAVQRDYEVSKTSDIFDACMNLINPFKDVVNCVEIEAYFHTNRSIRSYFNVDNLVDEVDYIGKTLGLVDDKFKGKETKSELTKHAQFWAMAARAAIINCFRNNPSPITKEDIDEFEEKVGFDLGFGGSSSI